MTHTTFPPIEPSCPGRSAPILGHRFGRRFVPRIVSWLCVVLASFVTLAPSPASAHADLLTSSPAANEVLTSSPETIELTFNEGVSAIESAFDLRGASGPVAFELSASIPEQLSLTPNGPLPNGSYLLLWQVESADGHIVSGTLRFSIGEPSASPIAGSSSERGVVLDRLLELFAWVGSIMATAAIILTASKLRLAAAASVLLFAGLRLVDMFDRLGSSAPSTGEFRAAAAVIAAAVVASLPIRPAAIHLGAVAVAFAAQGWFSGHHRTDELSTLLYAAHPLHLAGALLWSSAVAAVVCSPSQASRASRVATFAVALLVPASAVLAFAMLSFTDPGRWEWTLSVKIFFTLAALAIGAWNHRFLRSSGHSPASLRRRSAAELFLIAVVAAASASIATATPGSDSTPHRDDGTSHDSNMTVPVGSESLNLVFDDGTQARMDLTELSVGSRANGMLFLDLAQGSIVDSLSWTLANESARLSGFSGSFIPMGDHFHAFIDLPAAGVYTIVVAATVDTFTSISATGSFTVPSPEQEVSP